MINGFEEQTGQFSKTEFEIIKKISNFLQFRIGKNRAITNSQIIKEIHMITGFRYRPERIRKVINHLRKTGMVKNLIASNNGYYVSIDDEEIKKYIESLRQRSREILSIANCLERQIIEQEKINNPVQSVLFK